MPRGMRRGMWVCCGLWRRAEGFGCWLLADGSGCWLTDSLAGLGCHGGLRQRRVSELKIVFCRNTLLL
jgi:hypothetical protein